MKAKTTFFCTECGNEFPKWSGKCPACGAWNTIVEQPVKADDKRPASTASHRLEKPVTLNEVEISGDELRFDTGLGELDRVLGGGAVQGSLVLVGGAPGIGKSTLLLQICEHLGENYRVLYVTGEESERQLKMRAQRLGVTSDNLLILSETNLTDIIDTDPLFAGREQRSRQCQSGQGVHSGTDAAGQGLWNHGLRHRPRQQRGRHRRPQGAGAHGGLCTIFRG